MKQASKKQPLIQLKDLHDAIKKYLYMEDTRLIDLVLAVMVSRMQRHCKLWLIVIAPSGSGKTELLRLFDDAGETTKVLKTITPQTLVNGYKNKKQHPDLAPLLRDKVLIVAEMAQLISLNPDAMRQVWSQLRDLYDGEAGKASGEGADKFYTDLNVTFIGCSTPIIEKRALIHQNLGTRELLFKSDDTDEDKLMKRIVQNTKLDKEAERSQLRVLVQEFLKSVEYRNVEVKPNVLKQLKRWSLTLSKLRASADLDNRNGELLGEVVSEQPTRILEQLLTLYRALKSLSDTYSDKKALDVIVKVVLSSTQTLRIKTLMVMFWNYPENTQGLSIREVGKKLGVSKNTANGQLNVLHNLGLLEVTLEDLFRINKNNAVIQHLSEHFELALDKCAQGLYTEETIED